MARTAQKKLNFLVDEKLADEMKRLIPSGERSRVVNEALRKELLRIKRAQVTERLMKRERPEVSTDEIVRILRSERYRAEK